MKILKYTIPVEGCVHKLPPASEFLSCQLQRNEIVVWFLTHPSEPEEYETIKFHVIGTNHPVPEPLCHKNFLNTLQFGPLVLHVFAEYI